MFFKNNENCVDYGQLIEKAIRSIVREALKGIKKNEKNKKYCFMFEVNTRHKGVKLPKNILSQYKDTITLIMQYQFSDLNIFDEYFSVNLSFGGVISNVVIPFDAILTFSDKENDFEIKFNNELSNADGEDEVFINYEDYENFFDDKKNISQDILDDNLVNFNDLKVKK